MAASGHRFTEHRADARPRPLAGKIIGIDPGHNGGNFSDSAYIDQQIWNGREEESCDTTGTATASGYTEARFNFSVASYLRADLIADGARVVMTRHSNNGVGPCVTTRAEIINRAHADVAIDIHADGGPASGRGFTVLEPVADGPNDKVIRASIRFGSDVRAALLKYTSMPESDYYGGDGVIFRDDLAGLNLDHGSEGARRMRQHAERHGCETAHDAAVPAATGPRSYRGNHRFPDWPPELMISPSGHKPSDAGSPVR